MAAVDPHLPSWLHLKGEPSWNRVLGLLPNWVELRRHLDWSPLPWSHPDVELALSDLQLDCSEIVAGIAEDHRRIRLAALSSGQLLELAELSLWPEIAFNSLAPSKYKTQAERSGRILDALIRLGLLAWVEGSLQPPLTLVTQVSAAAYPSQPLWREIARRSTRHKPGFAAAMIYWSWDLTKRDREHAVPADLVSFCAGYLQHRLKLRYPRVAYAGDNLAAIPARVFLAIKDVFGDADPLQAIADSLEGNYDGVGTAIKNDLIDDVRQSRKRNAADEPREAYLADIYRDTEEYKVSWEDRVGEPDPDQLPHNPLRDEMNHVLQPLFTRFPKMEPYVEALKDRAKQCEGAEEARITDRTARNYDEQLRQKLAHLIQERPRETKE